MSKPRRLVLALSRNTVLQAWNQRAWQEMVRSEVQRKGPVKPEVGLLLFLSTSTVALTLIGSPEYLPLCSFLAGLISCREVRGCSCRTSGCQPTASTRVFHPVSLGRPHRTVPSQEAQTDATADPDGRNGRPL